MIYHLFGISQQLICPKGHQSATNLILYLKCFDWLVVDQPTRFVALGKRK